MLMKTLKVSAVSMSLALLASLPTLAFASEQDDAVRLCQDQIRRVYGVNDFRHVWADPEGNHKFIVHGKVRQEDHQYPFNCKIKRGHVKSYAYDGPHDKHADDSSDLGKAVAVGVGLAIVAAIASQAGKDDASSGSQLPKQSVLEDECHDNLQYRMRDEHYSIRNVRLKSSRLEGRTLMGDGAAIADDRQRNRFTYTCYFDESGHVVDSRYHLY
jgi:hypothetical protein